MRKIKIDGNEARFLNNTMPKADILFKCINLMVKNNVPQKQLAVMSGIPHDTVRKMFRSMSFGSVENYELLLKVMMLHDKNIVALSNSEIGFIPQKEL
ncbi:hypothetical protein [Citrobacter portucalensis]|uniref:hypothetical protein n=1 Tax=Citrobacter portucalensis TaxID=1639133 RepID=UPI00254B3540|nr:hypothetical protein [Citrobacter portucalensis]